MKNPELLEEFDDVLAAYNEMNDVNFSFTDNYLDPDIICCEESTADGYSVWVLKETDDQPILCDNVYYYEPQVSDLFALMHDMETGFVEAMVEMDYHYIREFMYEALCAEFAHQESLK
jgi:hypothetical protein|tara:strand:+ start:474 stop:827 length:354 start_codon:yes stop_codon:yes gene_type:complete